MNVKDETKVLAKMFLLPILIKALLISEIVNVILFFILFIIQNFLFRSAMLHFLNILIFVIIAIVCLILIIVFYQQLKKLTNSDTWQQLVDQAMEIINNEEYVQEEIYDKGTFVVGKFISLKDNGYFEKRSSFLGNINDRKAEATLLATLLGYRIPSTSKYFLTCISIPVIVLIVSFIPTYIHDYGIMSHRQEIIVESIDKITDSLYQECDYVYSDDPYEYYSDYGYYISGYLDDDEDRDYAYVNVTVNSQGLINGVNYSIDVDVNASKQDNLALVQSTLTTFNNLLNEANVEAIEDELLTEYNLSDEFINWFETSSYYDEESFYEDNMMISYYSTPEEEYDEYALYYVYVSVFPENYY